jgi:HlyD family secretion protein
MRRKKILWFTLGGLALLIIILVIAKARKGGGDTEVETAKVSRQTIIETVNASGKIQPEKEVKISADISGEIIELNVKEGDKIKKGKLLVRIKPDEYQRAVERAEAGVNSAQASLANSKAGLAQSEASFKRVQKSFDRSKTLYDQKAISKADFENAQSEYEVAEAQLESARQTKKGAEYSLASAMASRKEAQDALNKTAIYAPIDGTISRLNVELGERVVGTMQMAGTELMRIANLAAMEVEVEVNENDIVRLAVNDTAEIEVDAWRGEVFKGVVTEIANSAASDLLSVEKVTNFIVKIRILESSYSHLMKGDDANPTPFRPGMTANVSIQTKKMAGVLAVPILAVTVRRDDKSRDTTTLTKENEVVFLFENGKARQRKVKTGIQDDMYIEVREGLKEGEEVISGPYRVVSKTLKDDMTVQKTKKENAGKGKD